MADVSIASVAQDPTAAVVRGSGDKAPDPNGGNFSDVLQKANDQPARGSGKGLLARDAGDATELNASPAEGESIPVPKGKVPQIQIFALKSATGLDAATKEQLADPKELEAELGKHLAQGQTAKGKKAATAAENENKSKEIDPADEQQPAATSATDVLGLLTGSATQMPSGSLFDVHPGAIAGGNTLAVRGSGEKTANHALAAIDTKAGAGLMKPEASSAAMPTDDALSMPSDDAAGAEAPTFRLTRSDGRGGVLDLQASSAQDAGPSAKQNEGRIENVTVVDTRRYLGLAGNTNSSAVTAALAGDYEWAHAMRPESALSNAAQVSSTGKVVNTLKIQMNPIDLGLVTATMRLSGEALNVDLKVETHEAYRQLKGDHDKIIEALRSQGYAVDNVTVTMTPAAERSNNNGQSGSQSGQQTLQQESQQNQSRERQGNTAQRRTEGGFDGKAKAGGEISGVDVAGGASAGVYL